MKFLTNIIVGAIVGGIGVYFTLDWQEENIVYSLSAPAKFGNINYQNLNISNTGWNPAVNVKIFVNHSGVSFDNAQSTTTLKNIGSEKNGLASIERLRRDETVTVSLAYKGDPLFGNDIKISSDRSIAELIENESGEYLPTWASILLTFFGITFVVGILASIAIPSYNSYIQAAKEAQEKAKQEAEQKNGL